jgi:hypothetical protein
MFVKIAHFVTNDNDLDKRINNWLDTITRGVSIIDVDIKYNSVTYGSGVSQLFKYSALVTLKYDV